MVKNPFWMLFLFGCPALLGVTPTYGALCVHETAEGRYEVVRDGRVVVSDLYVDLGTEGVPEEHSHVKLPDGTSVWNRWNEDRSTRYRLEIAQRSDGAIEISMIGQMEFTSSNRTRRVAFAVPLDALKNNHFEALKGNGRTYSPVNGILGEKGAAGNYRWLSVDGLTFDFNALGAAEYGSNGNCGNLCGVWNVLKSKDGKALLMSGGATITKVAAGLAGTKIVIREGTFNDYDRIHFLRDYRYSQHLKPSRLFCFGAERHSKAFRNGNLKFNAKRGYGWVTDGVRVLRAGSESGAYCSAISGNDDTYRISGLPDGWYVLTVASANVSGEEKSFDVMLNGDLFVQRHGASNGRMRTVSRPVHVVGGNADIALCGAYKLSVLALQPVLGDAEDYSVSRCFWLTDGYEPGVYYRSADYRRDFKPGIVDDVFDIGLTERCNGTCEKSMPLPMARVDWNDPGIAWVRNVNMYRLFSNNHTLSELDDPGERELFFDREISDRGYNAVMVSGMHSRHTFPARLDRGLDSIGALIESAHRRGLKYIDHHDATVLWNGEVGLRVLMERLPELMRGKEDLLPSFQFCPNNPEYNRKYGAYLREVVRRGVDGFQIDELQFWRHGCACVHCRRKFTEDTGLMMPLDETSPELTDIKNARCKRLLDWRRRRITNWFVELKRSLSEINPKIVFNNYTTHYGYGLSLSHDKVSHDIVDQCRMLGLAGTEVMTRNPFLCARPLIALRKMNNMLTTAFGTPVWGWYYAEEWQNVYFCWALSNLTGQSALLPPDVEVPAGAPDWNRFASSPLNMKRIGAEPIATVAVLYSTASRDWGRRGCCEEALGIAQGLEAIHVPYEIITDVNLTSAKLAKYKMLFLAESECLDSETASAIRGFATAGGRIHMCVPAGTSDGLGMKRQVWPLEGIGVVEDLGAARYCVGETAVGKPWKYAGVTDAEKAFRARLADLTAAVSWLRADAPEQLYLQPWQEADGSVVIHILNATRAYPKWGEPIPPTVPNEVFPALKDDLVITVNKFQATNAVAVSPDFPGAHDLRVELTSGSQTKVYVPKELIRAYTLIRMSQTKK